ncbi:MAG: hypothetical protein GVY36_09265, partial [Verrucomicrobia bacterium]|nr:hypothetical protein [Verrucomicrobiota bacterium]
REGEKLHEALHSPSEAVEATPHEKIHQIKVSRQSADQARAFLRSLDEAAERISAADPSTARDILFQLATTD